MKERTKILKNEMKKDLAKIKYKKHLFNAGRRPEQAIKDARRHYITKWEKAQKQAETEAQKRYCKTVLNQIDIFL